MLQIAKKMGLIAVVLWLAACEVGGSSAWLFMSKLLSTVTVLVGAIFLSKNTG